MFPWCRRVELTCLDLLAPLQSPAMTTSDGPPKKVKKKPGPNIKSSLKFLQYCEPVIQNRSLPLYYILSTGRDVEGPDFSQFKDGVANLGSKV